MQEYIEFFANHPFLTAIWFVLFFAVVYTVFQSKFSTFNKVNPQQLTLLVNREDAGIVDIRGQADFNKGHIAGALNLTAEQVEGGKNPKLEKFKKRPIIIVCAAGMSASKVANQLAQAEFENVNILEGGMNAWVNANLPVAKG